LHILCVCMCMCVALVIQHVKRMSLIVLSYMICSVVQYFSEISDQGMILRKVTEHIMCVLIFPSNLFKTFASLRRNQRDFIINIKMSSCKIPLSVAKF
jgi:hypothetical protein